jgi:hypothetical protein
MMGRNRRRPAGRRGSSLKARLGIAAAVAAGGAIGAVAVAAAGHTTVPPAEAAGYSRHYQSSSNQANVLATALSDHSKSHTQAFSMFSHLTNTGRETEMWHGKSKLAFERGTVVLATRKFVLIRAANGTFNVWWLSSGTKVTNVAGSLTGTAALTGSTRAASQAMAGQMQPATSILTGNTTAARQMLASTAPAVTVSIAGTGITVSVTVTRNMATVRQGAARWHQGATTTAAGLQRGDLVFIAGTRASHELHAKVILIGKIHAMTATPTTAPTAAPTMPPTATPTTAPAATPTTAPAATPTTAPAATPSASTGTGSTGTGTVGGSGYHYGGNFNGGGHS